MLIHPIMLLAGAMASVVHNPQATDVCGCQVTADLQSLVTCLDHKVADRSCTAPLLLDTITYGAAADVCLAEGPAPSGGLYSISPKVMKYVTVAIDPLVHMEFSSMQVQVDQLCQGMFIITGNITASDTTGTVQCPPTLKTANVYTDMEYSFDTESKMLTISLADGDDPWTISDAQYIQLWLDECAPVDNYQAVALSTVYQPVLPYTQDANSLFGVSVVGAVLVLLAMR